MPVETVDADVQPPAPEPVDAGGVEIPIADLVPAPVPLQEVTGQIAPEPVRVTHRTRIHVPVQVGGDQRPGLAGLGYRVHRLMAGLHRAEGAGRHGDVAVQPGDLEHLLQQRADVDHADMIGADLLGDEDAQPQERRGDEGHLLHVQHDRLPGRRDAVDQRRLDVG